MAKGFSLLEILVSICITLVIGTAVFEMFRRNERVFHDHNLVTEMQQGARAALSQAADEIRMAGQGVPLFAASYDAEPSESTVAILAGSSSTRINFRAGLAPAESTVLGPVPLQFVAGAPITLNMDDITGLYNAVGGSPAGRFAYVWGPSGDLRWSWARASINTVSLSTRMAQVTTLEAGPNGAVNFTASPTISLEEATAIYLDTSTGSVRRTTATDLTNPASPVWAPANELLSDVTRLQLDYFDRSGNALIPDTLAHRAQIAQVNIRLAVRTTQDLSNHTRPEFAMTVRTNIRNRTAD